ncbi:hypothetical protein D0869_11771 [Hortaea werneckii]|uniref:Glycosyl transferase family 1 domain-containing protein n=1 Tax=Hortaea werneckii TaxID=91943 RepID=A0A3M6W9V6_HORWE|nr:hypothetical protein KC324_g7814 [Hortaea werneckii]KAI7594339.1 hypothetical protein KC316_g1185 [Hortaea werneckii]RMX75275.1 hypothetical protein D0869_11771 [Hortaea werneckii]RMX95692.1 hypothetical protein D0868_11590 [Hortaea werneckii]
MDFESSSHTEQQHQRCLDSELKKPDFPRSLVGASVLLATESLGPVNGVSRTTQSLIDYLRSNGVNVATCSPQYAGQHINTTETKPERQPIINPDFLRKVEAKSSALASRAIGGSWQFHDSRRDSVISTDGPLPLTPPTPAKNPPIIKRNRSGDIRPKQDHGKPYKANLDFRLKGFPLPYNPDLTVAYPFRLGVVYDQTFNPDIVYLASPASVGFQFLIQLRQLDNPPPTFLNFQTDLSAYAEILFPSPLDRYAVYLLHLVQGYLFRSPSVQTIFYPSSHVRTYMEAAGAPSHKMSQLGRGVDTDLFNPYRRVKGYRKTDGSLLAPNGEIILACVCRLAPEKGLEFLAQATRKLAGTGLAFKLLVAGDNKNQAVVKEVKDFFRGLEDYVHFTGMLRGTDLAEAYAAADIFLHCSITETFGLVVLESMASGVPVIARDEGGPSETVKHGRSGYLVPPNDLDAFVKLSYDLATDQELRERLSANARAQALDTTWEKINNAVAVELAAALERQPHRSDHQKRHGSDYGTWTGMLRVYLAVGLIWGFWFIAVIPMLACGKVHGLIRKKL